MTLPRQKVYNRMADAVGCNNYPVRSERKFERDLKDIPDDDVIDELIEINLTARDGERKMIAQREIVYSAFDGERDYQDSLRSDGRFSENVLPLPGELVCIQSYLNKAIDSYTNNPGEAPTETLHIIRKIGAMCVRAMENHGVYFRE